MAHHPRLQHTYNHIKPQSFTTHTLRMGQGGGEVSPRNSVVQSACQYDVTSRVRFIKGCIILDTVRIFSSSELVNPRIIPLKVRLAVALKWEAK